MMARVVRAAVACAVGAVGACWACACGSSAREPVAVAPADSAQAPRAGAVTAAAPEPEGPEVITQDGLVTRDLRLGKGALAESGSTVKVHYVGTLTDGQEFDSSHDRGQPLEFQLGRGMVIRGWDEGIKGMRVGGVRKLRIPPDLAYGDAGMGKKIPPRATLVFQVQLVDIVR